MLFEFDSLAEQKANLKVIGVGGAGGNAVNRMIQAGMSGVDFMELIPTHKTLKIMQQKIKYRLERILPKVLGPVQRQRLEKMQWMRIKK